MLKSERQLDLPSKGRTQIYRIITVQHLKTRRMPTSVTVVFARGQNQPVSQYRSRGFRILTLLATSAFAAIGFGTAEPNSRRG